MDRRRRPWVRQGFPRGVANCPLPPACRCARSADQGETGALGCGEPAVKAAFMPYKNSIRTVDRELPAACVKAGGDIDIVAFTNLMIIEKKNHQHT